MTEPNYPRQTRLQLLIDLYRSALKRIVQAMNPGSRATKIALKALNDGRKLEGKYEKENLEENHHIQEASKEGDEEKDR